VRISSKLLFSACLCLACAIGARVGYDAHKARVGTRVLFVGNSFTFVNNLPAVFAALGQANGFPVATQMLVKSGAALADRIADGSVERLLTQQHYDYVVLQERAGSVLCDPRRANTVDSCEVSRRAHHDLANLALSRGAHPVLLGTYLSADLTQALQTNERFLAREIDAIYVPVADKLLLGEHEFPDLIWLAADGGHPGVDLTLLDAVLLYQAVFSALPKTDALIVHGPIYDLSTVIFTLDWGTVRAARNEQVYDSGRVAHIVELAKQP